MKGVKLAGSVCLVVASSWALFATKSDFYYDKLAYGFFLSSEVAGILISVTNDDQVEKHAEKDMIRTHMFSTSLLTTEICLTAGMDSLLAFSNLLLPALHLVKDKRDNWEIVASSLWYSTLLVAIVCHSLDVSLGYLLTFSIVLGNPKFTRYYSYIMGLSIILGRITISQLKNAV